MFLFLLHLKFIIPFSLLPSLSLSAVLRTMRAPLRRDKRDTSLGKKRMPPPPATNQPASQLSQTFKLQYSYHGCTRLLKRQIYIYGLTHTHDNTIMKQSFHSPQLGLGPDSCYFQFMPIRNFSIQRPIIM